MRDNFIFFKSFYDAIECLGEKSQLKLYKAIMRLNFNCCENMTELEQLCDEIETELKQNRNVFAQFLLMKPAILKSANQHFKGVLGGAPKGNSNAKKTTHKEEEKEIGKEYKEKEIKEKENFIPVSSPDLFFQNDFNKYLEIYKANCPDLLPLNPFISRNKEMREVICGFINEIDNDVGYFTELCQKANELKTIVNTKIDLKSLIKNHIGIMSGKYIEEDDITQFLKGRK